MLCFFEISNFFQISFPGCQVLLQKIFCSHLIGIFFFHLSGFSFHFLSFFLPSKPINNEPYLLTAIHEFTSFNSNKMDCLNLNSLGTSRFRGSLV